MPHIDGCKEVDERQGVQAKVLQSAARRKKVHKANARQSNVLLVLGV
jgi:hypothetical protein